MVNTQWNFSLILPILMGVNNMGIGIVIKSFFDSFQIIKEAKLRKFYFFPGIIGIVLFMFFVGIGDFISVNLTDFLENFFQLYKHHSVISIFIKILIWLCSILFYYLIYKSLLLVILSPILGYVSERVETHLTGKKYNFTMKDNISFIIRSIDIGLRSFIKQMIGTCIIMLLGFIFPINLSIPFLIFILQGYFTGFSFMDYTLERYRLSSSESMNFLKKQRVCSAISGIIFTLLFLIPFFGIFIAPLVTCVAVTKITVEILNNTPETIKK